MVFFKLRPCYSYTDNASNFPGHKFIFSKATLTYQAKKEQISAVGKLCSTCFSDSVMSFFFGLVNLNSAFARHCGNYSSFLKSIILKCQLRISTYPHMPYVTCSCLIFQALGSLFPSLYSFPVTPILSYLVLASNLSFFPLPAPNFYYYTHGEGRKWRRSISPRQPSQSERTNTTVRLPVFFQK